MKVSNCCGASMNSMWQDYKMCPDCHDHCEAVEEEEDNATFSEHLEEIKN